MGKHLPPPKSRHLKQAPAKKPVNIDEHRVRQEKILSEYSFSAVELVSVAAAAALLAAAWLLPFEGWVKIALFALPCLTGGFETAKKAVEKALAGDFVQDDLLVIIAMIGAFCIGEYPAAGIIIILYRAGKLTEAYAVGKSKKTAAELADIRAAKASVETENGVVSIRPQEIKIGDVIIVDPGERIPLDGIIIEGMSSLDASALTGSPKPLTAAVGGRAVSGCVNLTSPVKLCVTSCFEDSTAARLMELVEKPVGFKAKQENLAARFSRMYTPVVVIAALVIGLIPPIFNGEWLLWLRKAIAFLVISGSGALAVSVPLAYFGGMRSAFKCGILIKGANFLETLAKTDTMIFGKTGVITEGKYTIVDIFPNGVSERQLLNAAAEAERGSNHPIAQMLRAATGIMPEDGDALQVEEVPGKGISAFVGEKHIYVGNAALLDEHGISCTAPSRKGVAIHVAVDNVYWGHIIAADKTKDGAFDALEALRHMGVNNMVLLTGDLRSIARPLASSLNFDMVKAELSARGKESAVEYLMAAKADNSAVSFVGDGDIDASVLGRADVGIAVGALRSEAAIENADLIIMADDLEKLPLAVKIAQMTAGIAGRNIAVVLAVKLLMLALALFGLLPVSVAALGDALVFIFALVNSLRSLKFDQLEEKF